MSFSSAPQSCKPLPPVALLCGGKATRLGPLAGSKPKALLPVAGEPFIAHQLRFLRQQGIRRVVICSGYLSEQIEAFVGDGGRFDLDVRFSNDGPTLLGTGGAVKKALPFLDKVFFILYGASYLAIDCGAVRDAFEASGKEGLLTVFRNEGKWDTSNIEFSAGIIRRYDKINRAPQMNFIDYGLGIVRESVFKRWSNNLPFDLADLYKQLVEEENLAGFEASNRFYEIGSEAGLAETDSWLRKQPTRI